jgi:hypothetical protein
MNPILKDALINLLAFLELSDAKAVEPDAAVRAMDNADLL